MAFFETVWFSTFSASSLLASDWKNVHWPPLVPVMGGHVACRGALHFLP
jgi:hypothetical protein